MKISKISVENFRSIEKLYNLELSSFDIFVGQNNHGKTNLFEAIDWFFVPSGDMEDICFMRDPSKNLVVEMEFSGLQRALNFFTNEKQKKFMQDNFEQEDSILIRRTNSYEEGRDRQLYNPKTKSWENPLGRDSTWKQFLPTLEFVSTKKLLDDVAKYGKATPISKMLSAVLESMLVTDKKYAEFKKNFNELFGDPADPDKKTDIRGEIDKVGMTVATFLQKQFPDCVDVKFKVENPELEDLFKKFKTTIDDGIENDSSEKGDGMQRALMLAIIQAYSEFRKDRGESKDFLFLIDEAELHLHPTAQRALKYALAEVASAGDQVLINTHSSVLVADNEPGQTIFKVEKINKITNVNVIADQEKPMLVFDLLGGSPADLLLPSNIIIVEGYSEVVFLRKVVQRFYPNSYEKIQIVPAEGDVTKQARSLTLVSNAYQLFKSKNNPYSSRVVVIADASSGSRDDDNKYSKFKSDHKELIDDERYFELPVSSLEQYYPEPYKADPSAIAGSPGKVAYAENVSKKITQAEFEENMQVFVNALKRAEEKQFS